MKMHLLMMLIIVMGLVLCKSGNSTDRVWPHPRSISSDPDATPLVVNPCDIKFVLETPSVHVRQMIDFYLVSVFRCTKTGDSPVTFNVIVKDTYTLTPFIKAHEEYSLTLRTNNKWELQATYYPGFLRGLQTWSQLFEKNDDGKWAVKGLPVVVNDGPEFIWRGLMIDSSRHFIPVQTIKHTLDGMMFNKLNVMHWHIIDEDSFPYEIPSIPELSQYGKIGGVYSTNDIKEIIAYARYRGIRVVPELDTPAHTESWGRSKKYKDITLNCNGQYQGQFDPSIELTWEVVQEVMRHTEALFDDNYIHFGGDEVVYDCWDQRPHIKQFMNSKGIKDYKELAVWYRQSQKQVWRNITASKKVIYWANQDIDLPTQDDDAIQWWGVSANVKKMEGRKNEVILSNYDLTYLDIGFGNRYGDHYGVYQSWRKMYNFNPRIPNVNVIGGETAMWSEIVNVHAYDQKVVQRSALLGQRLWNDHIDINEHIRNIATRLVAHSDRLRSRGFKVWPVTVGLCEKDMSICFP